MLKNCQKWVYMGIWDILKICELLTAWRHSQKEYFLSLIQFSLTKKTKIQRPEHSLNPHLVSPIPSRFTLFHPPPPAPFPLKADSICVSPLKSYKSKTRWFFMKILIGGRRQRFMHHLITRILAGTSFNANKIYASIIKANTWKKSISLIIN